LGFWYRAVEFSGKEEGQAGFNSSAFLEKQFARKGGGWREYV
jgi:hypothetical protein